VQEWAAFVLNKNPKNDLAVRAAMAKYLRLPLPAVEKMQISPPGPVVSEKQLQWWIGLMKEQDMLRTSINTAGLIAK
jgi:NitT/TauT family transport system substrate-binding protein